MEITGNTALVTGGASGLGLATVRRLHEAGAPVVILDLPRSDGTAIARELGARPGWRCRPARVRGGRQFAGGRQVRHLTVIAELLLGCGPYQPTAPSVSSRIRSACPLWRAYSSIMWT